MLLLVLLLADLLPIPKDVNECALGFVNNSVLVVIGNGFESTYSKFRHMYLQLGGARNWASAHFSKFEPTKFKFMDLAHTRASRQTTI